MQRAIGSGMQRLGRRLLEVICPVGCLGCEAGLPDAGADMCPQCWKKLMTQVGKDYCDICGFSLGPYHVPGSGCPSCRPRRFRFDSMVRVSAHEGLGRSLVLSFKSARRPDAVRILAGLVSSAIAGRPEWTEVDALVPIPVAYRKRLWVGEPVVVSLARHVGQHLGWPVAEALRVVRAGPPQRGLSATQRWANVRGRFGLSRGASVSGASLCLVDDVSTTGATLNEAAKVLKAAGAARVLAAVVTKRDPAAAAMPE